MLGSPKPDQKMTWYAVFRMVSLGKVNPQKSPQWLIQRGECQGRWTIHFGPHVLTDDSNLAKNWAEMSKAKVQEVIIQIPEEV